MQETSGEGTGALGSERAAWGGGWEEVLKKGLEIGWGWKVGEREAWHGPVTPCSGARDGVTRCRRLWGADAGLRGNDESSTRRLAYPSPGSKDGGDG